MNKIIFKAALLVAISFVVVTQIIAQSSTKNTFTLKIANVKNVGSTIHIGFYKKENEFPTQKKHAFAKEFIPSTTGDVSVSWNDIPEGDYALAVYQDLDSNGVLKTNMFGYPKEPFCFSRNFIPKLSKPKFEQCFFSFNAINNTFSVELIN